jgi:hypothetical protein
MLKEGTSSPLASLPARAFRLLAATMNARMCGHEKGEKDDIKCYRFWPEDEDAPGVEASTESSAASFLSAPSVC